MNNFKKPVLALCVIAQLSIGACASKSDKIQATYVSPLQYQDYSCRQIRAEMVRISQKVNEVSGVQDKQASNDSVAMGVGLILFWPALFFLIGDDQKAELSNLKGQYDALQQAAIQKDCDVVKEMESARKMEAERKEKQKQENQPSKGENE
jgi:hypothetical protein